jgi:hypothetical protein
MKTFRPMHADAESTSAAGLKGQRLSENAAPGRDAMPFVADGRS